MLAVRCPSSRPIPKLFIFLLTWVVVASLSWADLMGPQAEPTGALLEAQVATEPDFDELRDEATTISLSEQELPARHSPITNSFSPAGGSFTSENPVPTRLLLSKLSLYRL